MELSKKPRAQTESIPPKKILNGMHGGQSINPKQIAEMALSSDPQKRINAISLLEGNPRALAAIFPYVGYKYGTQIIALIEKSWNPILAEVSLVSDGQVKVKMLVRNSESILDGAKSMLTVATADRGIVIKDATLSLEGLKREVEKILNSLPEESRADLIRLMDGITKCSRSARDIWTERAIADEGLSPLAGEMYTKSTDGYISPRERTPEGLAKKLSKILMESDV